MENLLAMQMAIMVAFFILGLLIVIAPLLIWRNTNRTNRLLTLIALEQGINAVKVREAFEMQGHGVPRFVLDAVRADAARTVAERRKDV